MGETDGLVIRGNTVVRNALSEGPTDNPPLWTPQIRVAPAARDVDIERNVTSKITGPDGQADWVVDGNVAVQDRTRLAPGFYELVFTGGDPADPASYRPRPGGPLDGVDAGARLAPAPRDPAPRDPAP